MFHVSLIVRKLVFIVAASCVAASALVFGRGGEDAHIIFMIAAALVALTALSMRRQKARHREGWKHLTVSLSDLLVLAALIGMTALFLYAFYFVGSARIDARFQMIAAQVLVLSFAVLSALAAWCTLGFNTRWNEQVIEQEGLFVGQRNVHIDDLASLHYEVWSNCYRLQTYNGTRIRIFRTHSGVEELVRDLSDRVARGRQIGDG